MLHDVIDVYEADVFKWSKLVTIEAWSAHDCPHCNDWHIVNDLDFDCLIEFDSEKNDAPVLTIVTAWIGGNEHGEAFDVSSYKFSCPCNEPHDGWGKNGEIMSSFYDALDQLLDHPDMQPVISIYDAEEQLQKERWSA